MGAGDIISLNNSSNSKASIDGVSGNDTSQPLGEISSVFFNESMDGVPRKADLFTIRALGQTSQVEWLKDIIKSQIASIDFDVVVDVPDGESREPSQQEIEAAENVKQFFNGNFNQNQETVDDLHGQLLDDVLDLNSGVLELISDNDGYLDEMYVRDGVTFTINQDEYGRLPGPDTGEPAYYQFGLTNHARNLFGHSNDGIDVNKIRNHMSELEFSRIFSKKDTKEFSRDQIVWFSESQNKKTYSPYGRGRTEKVKDAAEIMINGDIHRNKFFLDNEFHKGVMAVGADLSQDQVQSIKNKLKGTAGNEHELPVVGSKEDIDYIPLDPEPEKMQFLESQKWYTKKLVWSYGLNDIEGGALENANKGISDNGKRQIWERVTSGLIEMFENRWNNQVLPFMREYEAVDGNLKVVYRPDNKFMEKIENEIIENELNSDSMTINEARERKDRETFGELGDVPKTAFEQYARNNPAYVVEQLTGLDDVPSGDGGNNPFQDLNINLDQNKKGVIDDDGCRQDRTEHGKKYRSKDSSDGEIDEDGSGSTAPTKIEGYREAFKHTDQLLNQTKDALRNQRGFDDVDGLVGHKESMQRDVAQAFEKSLSDLQGIVEQEFPEESQENGVLVDADKIVDQLSIKERISSVLESNNLGALEMSAEHFQEDVENETEERYNIPEETKVEISFNVLDTFTADIIRQEALQSATEIDSSIKNRLKRQILKGAEKGEGIPEITDRVSKVSEDITDNHAELVARTETLQSSRKGSQALAESTDLVQGKEWISTSDSRVREWHKTMDGTIVEKDGQFTVPSVSDDQPNDYPRSARVVGEDQPFNCRCSQSPVLAEDMPDTVQQLDQDFDNILVDLGMSKRRFEVWKQHSKEDEDSFEEFWSRVVNEKSKTEIAEDFSMSNSTVYNWSG